MGNSSASPTSVRENAAALAIDVREEANIVVAPPPSSSASTPIKRTGSFSRNAGGVPRVMSSDSLAGRGRQLLETFEKVRSDHASRYGGDDEAATVAFCSDVLIKGAPDWAERYTVIRTVSCGTTSVVCLARDEKSAEREAEMVAIKYARLGNDPSSKEFRERRRQFEIEAKLQRRCACANVAKLLDFRIVDMFAIFVMEYLPRTLLEDIVESNRTGEFPELRSARHVRAIAQALETCHSMSIAHLDIKLDNILISANGEAKLCDFGLADLVPVFRSAATPLYSPPEIITQGRCDEKADMWSLGVCVFILLCGYPPFQPDDRHDLNDNICKARYSFKGDEGWAHVSTLARDLVARLLVIDPEQRWSARQVLEHPWIVAAAAMKESPIPPSLSMRMTQEVQISKLTRPPLLKRQQSIVNLERMAERKLFEEEQRHKRSLSSFLVFAEDVRKAWKQSGWEGVADVGKRDPNLGNIILLAEDIGRGWKQGGIHGAIRSAKSFTLANQHGLKDGDAAGCGPMMMVSASTSSSELEEDSTEPLSGRTVGAFSSPGQTSATSSSDFGANEPLMTSDRREDRADSKLFLRAMYGSTSPLRPPTWVPDSEASGCRLCEVPFTFFRRRHHCRSCGQVVCNDCSMRRRIVARVDPNKLVRVCNLCSVSSRVM